MIGRCGVSEQYKVVYHNPECRDLPYVVPAEHECDADMRCSPSDEIAICYGDRGRLHADQIVHEHNAHDELVAVIEDWLFLDDSDAKAVRELANRAHAALAEAGHVQS